MKKLTNYVLAMLGALLVLVAIIPYTPAVRVEAQGKGKGKGKITSLEDVLCKEIQRLAGQPSPEAVDLCGEKLFKVIFVTSTTHNGHLRSADSGGPNPPFSVFQAATGFEGSLAGQFSVWAKTAADQ